MNYHNDGVDDRLRQEFFDAAERDYKGLEADPEALAEYLAEIALWDGTLADGLPDETWSEDDISNREM